jgi:hypothetical protein
VSLSEGESTSAVEDVEMGNTSFEEDSDEALMNSLRDTYKKSGESSSGVKSLSEQEDAKPTLRRNDTFVGRTPRASDTPLVGPSGEASSGVAPSREEIQNQNSETEGNGPKDISHGRINRVLQKDLDECHKTIKEQTAKLKIAEDDAEYAKISKAVDEAFESAQFLSQEITKNMKDMSINTDTDSARTKRGAETADKEEEDKSENENSKKKKK